MTNFISGWKRKETHKYVSELIGKETIDTNTYGETKGRSGSYSTNYQQSGRELLTPDEVRMLDNRYALLFIRGERVIMDHKYNLMKHPNVKLSEDGGAEPYDYAKAPLAHDTFAFDADRYDDYELLSDEDIIGEPFHEWRDANEIFICSFMKKKTIRKPLPGWRKSYDAPEDESPAEKIISLLFSAGGYR